MPRDWPGQTAFIVAGGPSVARQDLSLLRGRLVIAINSSWEAVPFATFLLFADHRWYLAAAPRLGGFKGRIVSLSKSTIAPGILHLDKLRPPPAVSDRPTGLVTYRTTLQGAINLAGLCTGWSRAVLLGADMRADPGGRTHHHAPHLWAVKPNCWEVQMAQLREMAPELAAKGMTVVNTSMDSKIDWWPKAPLEDCL